LHWGCGPWGCSSAAIAEKNAAAAAIQVEVKPQ